jgi:hypothetical protein
MNFKEGAAGGVENGVAEIFPKNLKVEIGKVGNLVAFPLGRKSEPLNPKTGKPCCRLTDGPNTVINLDRDIEFDLNIDQVITFFKGHQHNESPVVDRIIEVNKLKVAKTSKTSAKKRTRGVQPTDTQIQVGNRNDTYFKMALKLFKKNLTLEEVTSILVDKNGEIEHPLEESEILSIVNSANTYIPETLGMSEAEAIDLLNSEHAVVTVGGKTKVLRSTINSRTGETTHVYMDVNDFKNLYSNKFFVDSEGTEKSLAPFWLTHIDRRTAHGGVKFDPSNQCTPDQINTFVGYPISPKSGECGMFKKLVVDAICAGDEELAEYIWDWLAHMFQRPWQLPEVALVLMGDQGIGKNVFVEVLGKLVGYYIMLTDPEQLIGRFSGHLEGKLLIFLNEATWGGNRSALGKLKSLISDKNMPVERKGLDIVQAKNYARVIIASNAKYPVHLEQGDRRLVILNVSPLYKGNYEFFKNLQIELDDGGYEALMKELLENDLTYFNPRNKPTTGHEHALLAESSTPVLAWILHILTTETIGDQEQLATNTSTSISKGDFYSEYVNHCNQHRARPQNIGAFFKEVYQYTPISPGPRTRVGPSRINMILIPALIDFIPAFEELTGMVVGDE